MDFLWSYVKDLADQNQVLVQTVEDLLKEADHTRLLGMKRPTSDHVLEVMFYNYYKKKHCFRPFLLNYPVDEDRFFVFLLTYPLLDT